MKNQGTYKGVTYRINGWNKHLKDSTLPMELVINGRKWYDDGDGFYTEFNVFEAMSSVKQIIRDGSYCKTDEFDSFYNLNK